MSSPSLTGSARARAAALAAVLAAVLAACSTDSAVGPDPARLAGVDAGTQLARGAGRGEPRGMFEVPYMKQTIDHHAMGVMMAQLCLEKATHEELRDLCETNLANQSRELEQLQTWLGQWYGITYEPEMTPGAERMMEKLAALIGAEFEIEFMETFSRHHWQIIHRSIPIARNAIHEPLERMAETIIAAQYEDVRNMRTWLCDWYDVCRPVPPLPNSVQ